MTDAGFELSDEPGIWKCHVRRPGFDGNVTVPVDLIVPSAIAPKAGRRGARLPGAHGRTAARKSVGVEGALVDFDPVEVAALTSEDDRRIVVNVAGPAALTVAKAHKLGERLDTPHRLLAKDAGDVYRLFDATAVAEMAALTTRLLTDERSAAATDQALGYVRRLFVTPRSPGVELATQALEGIMDESTVTTAMTAYARQLLESVQS